MDRAITQRAPSVLGGTRAKVVPTVERSESSMHLPAGRDLVRVLALSLVVALSASVAACGSDSPTTSSSSLVSIGAGIEGPSGLHATTYATGLDTVAGLAFDAEGKLWASTASYQDDGKDAVYLIAKAGATPRKVISGLHSAIGLLWFKGELYVASKERVHAYSGFDGTRFATMRTVVALPSGVGEVNGLAVSTAGRISLGISSPCDHCDPTSPYSAAVVSFLPDGSGLRVDASGIRAAVGLTYDATTGDLFATMNQRDDLGTKTPGDSLGVIETGQDWKFPDCYGQKGTACTDTPDPVAELDDHAAVSGVTIDEGGIAGAGRVALVAEYAKGKVLKVVLKGTGAQTTGTATTFLSGFTNPVPISTGPDGSIYVGDWGSGSIVRVAQAS